MPSSHHLLNSCTNTNLGLPFLPKSTTLTQQPLKFMNGLLPTPNTFKSQADKHCTPLAPLSAGQAVAMYDALCKIWIHTTVVCILPKDSYQVCTSDSTVYHHTRWFLHECSVKPADTVPDATTATPQTPSRPHVSAPQPAPTRPAQPMLLAPVAPAMPVTPNPQTTAVPTILAVPRVAPVSMPATPSVAHVQPRWSGHAYVAPKCLIQEIWLCYSPWQETRDWNVPGLHHLSFMCT